jgi:hypothetical protein
LIDQLNEIWIDGELDAVETANWVPKLLCKDFPVAQSLSGSAVDDPDTQFYENYSGRSSRNYTGCNSEVDALIERRSAEIDPAKRKQMVWQIERKLIEDAVRPIIFFMRQGTCWQPEVKGLTLMDNSIFNSRRMEDGSTGELIEDHVLDGTIRRLLVVCSRPAAGNVASARFGKNHWSATPAEPLVSARSRLVFGLTASLEKEAFDSMTHALREEIACRNTRLPASRRWSFRLRATL